MKKGIIFCLIGLIVLVLLFLPEKKEIRVRVIPNSNNYEDLKVKEEIKEKLVNYLVDFKDYSYSDLVKELSNTDKIKECLGDTVSVYFGPHNFPVKTYNGNILESKNVDTLLITIDSGLGDNWWGTLYPNYLGIESSQKVTYESFFLRKAKEIMNLD